MNDEGNGANHDLRKSSLKILGQLCRHNFRYPKPDPTKGPVVGILLDIDYLVSSALKRDRVPAFGRIAATIAGPAYCEPTACIGSGGGVPAKDMADMLANHFRFRATRTRRGTKLLPQLLVEGIRTLQWPGIEELCVVSRNSDLAVLAEEANGYGVTFSLARYAWTPAPMLDRRASRVVLLGDWHLEKIVAFEMVSTSNGGANGEAR